MYRQNVIKINEMRMKWWASDKYCWTGSVFLLVNKNTELFLLTCCCRYFLLLLLFLFFFFSSFSSSSPLILFLFLSFYSFSSPLFLSVLLFCCHGDKLLGPSPTWSLFNPSELGPILGKCLLQVGHDGAYKAYIIYVF